jgi:hypothetical protein
MFPSAYLPMFLSSSSYVPICPCSYLPMFLSAYVPIFIFPCSYLPIFLSAYVPMFLSSSTKILVFVLLLGTVTVCFTKILSCPVTRYCYCLLYQDLSCLVIRYYYI